MCQSHMAYCDQCGTAQETPHCNLPEVPPKKQKFGPAQCHFPVWGKFAKSTLKSSTRLETPMGGGNKVERNPRLHRFGYKFCSCFCTGWEVLQRNFWRNRTHSSNWTCLGFQICTTEILSCAHKWTHAFWKQSPTASWMTLCLTFPICRSNI